MSRLIALAMGAWITYCLMIGDWVGGFMLLGMYLLTLYMDPFELNKKSTSAGDTGTRK